MTFHPDPPGESPPEGPAWWTPTGVAAPSNQEDQTDQYGRPYRAQGDEYGWPPGYFGAQSGSYSQPGTAGYPDTGTGGPEAPPWAPPRGGPRWVPVALVAAVIGALVGGGLGAGVAANWATTPPTKVVREVIQPNTQIAKLQTVPAILAKVEPGVVSVTTNLGAGTGMILTADGQVLTNYHVVSGATSIKVTLFNETTPRTASLKGFDRSNDVALLQIPGASRLPTVSLGDSDALQVGDDVIAVGNALNLAGGPTVTEGIVSAKGRSIDPSAPPNLIQTDAAINPGNSGGPLVNGNGQVVGMNTLVIQQANSQEAAQNLGFAIPVNTLKPLVPDLVKGVQRVPAYMGVGVVTLTPDIATRLGITATQGAIIQDLPSDGPAASAGLQQSDVIVSFDGQPVATDTALVQLIHGHKPGDKVQVGYIRGATKATVTVTLGTTPTQSP